MVSLLKKNEKENEAMLPYFIMNFVHINKFFLHLNLLQQNCKHFDFICELQQYQGHGPWLGCFEDPVR